MPNISVSVQDANNLSVTVTPPAQQVIAIDRGVAGPPGPNSIGGYGFNITNPQPYDVLMFGGTAWVNTPQTEITDGGNF